MSRRGAIGSGLLAPSISPVLASLRAVNRGWWNFEGNGLDSSRNGADLTASGSPSYATGKIGQGIDLEAAGSQYLSRADGIGGPFDFADTSFFVSFFVNPESISSSHAYVSKYESGASNWLCYYEFNTAVKLCWYINGVQRVNSATSPTVGVWQHLLYEHDADADECRIWLNDESTYFSQAHSGGCGSSATPLKVGAWSTASDPADGIMDLVGIFSGISTPAQRNCLRNYGQGRRLY